VHQGKYDKAKSMFAEAVVVIRLPPSESMLSWAKARR